MDSPRWRYYIGFYTSDLSKISDKTILDELSSAFKVLGYEDVSTSTSSPNNADGGPRVKVESRSAKVSVWFGSEFIFVPIDLDDISGAPLRTLKSMLGQSSSVGRVATRSAQIHAIGEGAIESDIMSGSDASEVKDLVSGVKSVFAYETSSRDIANDIDIRNKVEFKRDGEKYSYELDIVSEKSVDNDGQTVASLVEILAGFDMKAQQDGIWKQARKIIHSEE